LGSIAKGYIADRLAEFFIKRGVISGLIDARGDIRVFGDREQIIEIQHPRNKEGSIGGIRVNDCGVATSGDYNQYDKNFEKSHIINQKDYISVTVIAPTLAEADVYASAVFVSPKEKIREILKDNKKIRVLCVHKTLKVEIYNNFEAVFENEI
jgi:thiamine biosynthesis lipoprotein